MVRWFLYYYGSWKNTVTTIARTSGRYSLLPFSLSLALPFPSLPCHASRLLYNCQQCVCVCFEKLAEGKENPLCTRCIRNEAVELSTLAHKFKILPCHPCTAAAAAVATRKLQRNSNSTKYCTAQGRTTVISLLSFTQRKYTTPKVPTIHVHPPAKPLCVSKILILKAPHQQQS